jgi:uncharacterized repeat protein (TIGR02543 family)
MKKLISISASLLLAGASLVAVAAPAHATANSATLVSAPVLNGTGYVGSAISVTRASITTTGLWSSTPEGGAWRWSDTPVTAGSDMTAFIGNPSSATNPTTVYWGSDLWTQITSTSTVIESTVSTVPWGGTPSTSAIGKYLYWVEWSGNFQAPNNGTYTTWSSSVRIQNAPVNYTLTYDPNHGAGMISATVGAGALTVSSGTNYTRSGYTLAGWNTSVDGLGTAVALGASYTPTQNETLYAQWTAVPVAPSAPAASSYAGPMFNAVQNRAVDSVLGGSIKLTGTRLSDVSKVELAGKTVKIVSASDSQIELVIPAGTPGAAELVFTLVAGHMTWSNAFTYVDPAVEKIKAANRIPKPAKPVAKKPVKTKSKK